MGTREHLAQPTDEDNLIELVIPPLMVNSKGMRDTAMPLIPGLVPVHEALHGTGIVTGITEV